MGNLFATKPLDRLMEEAKDVGEHSLKRSLGPVNLIALGIGAIIGAGLFVRTAAAIADRAGPSVVLAFMVAGLGCAFAGLCYAEFASMIPLAGSAYTYSYATMGEFVAWIIGWDLILEYAVAAATVAIAWSEYANRVLEWFGMRIPYQWSHSPFETAPGTGVHGIMNIPSVLILLVLTLLLIRGTKESAFVNGLIVVLKVAIVLLFIGIGWSFINPANHTPLIPAATTYTTPQGNYARLRRNPWHSRRRRRGLLRLYRLRRGLDRRAGSEKSKARHADWDSWIAGDLHGSLCVVRLRAERRGHGAGLSHGRPRSLGRVCHHQIHARVRMALEVSHGRDSRRLFVGHPRVARPVARLLFDESRWTCAEDFFGRASAVQNALQIEPALLCLHRPDRGLRSGGRHR